MELFERLIWAALATAVLVGSVQTGVQRWQAAPLILAAEVYEEQKAEAPKPAEATAAHTHADGAAPHAHEHPHAAAKEWEPQNGGVQHGWTWVANMLHAFSMALSVFAVMGVWLYRRGGAVASLRLAGLVAAAGWLSFHFWPSLACTRKCPAWKPRRCKPARSGGCWQWAVRPAPAPWPVLRAHPGAGWWPQPCWRCPL